jgi:ribose transport system permease protein
VNGDEHQTSRLQEPDRPKSLEAWIRDAAFRFRSRYRVIWIALAILAIVCAVAAPKVYTSVSLRYITVLAGILAVATAGQLLVIMTGGIDLSVPAVMTIGAAVIVKQTQGLDSRLLPAILEAVAAGLVVGLANGLLIALFRLNALIVTLAMSSAVMGLIMLWAGTSSFSASDAAPQTLIRLGNGHVGAVSTIAFIGIGLLSILALVLKTTRPGHKFVAAGSNPLAAEIVGIRVVTYKIGGYVVGGALYSVAGLLLAGVLQNPDYSIGTPYQLSTIVAAALAGASLAGGPASVIGAGAGCLFVTLAGQFLTVRGMSGGVIEIFNGAVLVAAVAIVTFASSAKSWLRPLHIRSRGRRLAHETNGRP